MKARTVCCKAIVDTKTAPVAKNHSGEFLVCSNECKEFMELATEQQMKKIMG